MQGFRGERGRSSRSRGAEGESKRRRRPPLWAASVDAARPNSGGTTDSLFAPSQKARGVFRQEGVDGLSVYDALYLR